MRQEEKLAMLVWLFRELLPADQQAMVFCATRQSVDYVASVLRLVRTRCIARLYSRLLSLFSWRREIG